MCSDCFCLEQVKGVEPSSKAWEALILPMNHTCTTKFYHCFVIVCLKLQK